MKKLSIRDCINKSFIVAVALIISLPLIFSMLDHRVIHGDDLFFHAGRIRSIALELPNQFPVYICRDWLSGLGVPATIFYPSLFFYIPAIIFKLGLSIETVYNGFLITLVFFSALISFRGFQKLFNKKLAIVIAAIYISQSYFLFDLYHRAALGEIFGMMFLPLAIAELKNISDKNIIPTILIFSCIIESHILTTLILIMIIFIYIVLNFRTIEWKIFGKIFLGTVALNAFFIVPFLYQYHEVDVWIKYITQQPISADSWTHLLFPIIFIEIFILISGIFLCREKFFWIIFFINLIFFIIATDFFHIDLISHVFQFQWRMFMICSICYSICLGIILEKIFHRKIFLFIICVLHAIFNTIYWQMDLKYICLTSEQFRNNLNYIDYAYHDISIEQFKSWRDNGIPLNNKTLPILYYEGYEITDSAGNVIPIHSNNNHLIELESGSIEDVFVNYKGLSVYKLANLVTFISIFMIIRKA